MCNPNKEILTVACMEPPLDSSWQIPSKSLESRMRKVNSSVSTKGNIIDTVEKDFDDLQAQALIMSCKCVKLDHLALRHKERVHKADNESINVTKASYLISFCSSYGFL